MFKVYPKDNYLVLPVPKEREETAAAGYYRAGYDHLKAVFYVNSSYLTQRQRHQCMALALHEAIPGHHLQSDTFVRSTSIPKFRRHPEEGNYYMIPGRFPLHTAYMEGWALYAEYLGEELDLFGNPYDLFGRLRSEMLRAARLVVDTGIHAFEWNRNEAIDYIVDVVGVPINFGISEIDRYITWPGQACAYKIGELKIHELRKVATERLSNKFDLKEFHQVLLSSGPAPLDFIEQNVWKYINKDQSIVKMNLRN